MFFFIFTAVYWLFTDAALGFVKSSSDLFKFNSNNSLLKFLFDVSA